MPFFRTGFQHFQPAQAIKILLLKCHSWILLHFLFFPAQRKLPVINALVIGIPCEPAAAHPVPGRQRIDLRCAFSHHFITVLIHVLRLDDLLRSVSVQERKQFIQLGGVVGSQCGNKGPVHQRVSDIRLEAAFRHIYNAGAGVAHKMNGAPRGRSHALSRGGQRQIFHARFLRWIVFILERVIQPDLCAADQTVYTEDGNDDAGCPLMEFDRPAAVIIHIEAGNTLHPAARLDQPIGQGAAQERGRRTLEAKACDLIVGQPPHRPEVLAVRRDECQHGQQHGEGLMHFLNRSRVRLLNLRRRSFLRNGIVR